MDSKSNQQNSSIPFEDYLNSFLNESTKECFDKCIKDYSKESLLPEEEKCIYTCFSKFIISYTNSAEMMGMKNK